MIYRGVVKQYAGVGRYDITIAESDRRDVVVREMASYVRKHGFTDGSNTIADIELQEIEEVTYKLKSVKHYADVIDVTTDKPLKEAMFE